MNTLGEKIKERRRAAGISQDFLAKKLGYRSRSTIAKIESGENDVSQAKIQAFADALDCSAAYLMGLNENPSANNSVKIPVLGRVAAGIPLEAVQDILDFEEISSETARSGEYFALQIKGNSMEPRICEGDVVIVRRQSEVESGEIAIVLVNGNDAVCKKVMKHGSGISLVSLNPAYEPMFFTNEEINSLPVTILGRMMELRGKF